MSYLQIDATSRVIPAQVNFLTIYNPELGNTDETEAEQIVFWASRDESLRRQKKAWSKGNGRASDTQSDNVSTQKDEADKTGNRLRHIGLARGMVEFANNFSNGRPVSSIETEKSRIILHEIENGWWILASIDLTRLPLPQNTVNRAAGKDPRQQYEYSAREVAPVQLLLAQLLRAHRVFLLHHAASLWELYHKFGRSTFCFLFEKYWGSFVWEWDVLLHGNPAVDIHGCCTKLAGGGELGMGVGEEEWGSGEREVLEGFIERTEGLVDLIVGRYGDPPTKRSKDEARTGLEEGGDQYSWLGHGENPGPADGIVFSGTNTLARKSLATISQWMEAIFKDGQNAYGIGENPSARSREKRRAQRSRKSEGVSQEQDSSHDDTAKQKPATSPKLPQTRGRAPDLRRKALKNSAAVPKVPAPLIGSVERSLEDAIARAASRSSSRSPKSSPTQEKSEEGAMRTKSSDATEHDKDANASSSSLFGSDTMMKVLTLGYGSSWTLTPKGWQDQGANEMHKKGESKVTDDPAVNGATKLSEDADRSDKTKTDEVLRINNPVEDRLQRLDPTPAVSDDDEDDGKPFIQRLERSAGRFLIGLSGDLEMTDLDEDEDESSSDGSNRIFLRTLVIEVDVSWRRGSVATGGRPASLESYKSNPSVGEGKGTSAPKTSAGASIDGPSPRSTRHEKVQVAIYVHQPFIFVFLFQLHTPSLTIPGFYHNIHYQLGPLQGPLLKRTDPERVAERIKDVIMSKDSNTTASTLAKTAAAGNVVFDLVYDPGKHTVRTSIPNIPIPAGTQQESGSLIKTTTISGSWYTLGIPISSSTSSSELAHTTRENTKDKAMRNKSAEQWTRLDALNVYGQILNSWIATRLPLIDAAASLNADLTALSATEELERTVKTSRGWWVLWMKVMSQPRITSQSQLNSRPLSAQSSSTVTQTAQSYNQQQAKEAFLIRKSSDYSPTGKIASKSGSGVRWLLREQSRDGNKSSSNTSGVDGSATGAGSISEGVGIDAKKWVEGLLHLSQ